MRGRRRERRINYLEELFSYPELDLSFSKCETNFTFYNAIISPYICDCQAKCETFFIFCQKIFFFLIIKEFCGII